MLNSWQKPALFNTVSRCPVESRAKSNEEQGDALHPSLVPLIVFHKITQFRPAHHLKGQQSTICTLFKVLTRLSKMLKKDVSAEANNLNKGLKRQTHSKSWEVF